MIYIFSFKNGKNINSPRTDCTTSLNKAGTSVSSFRTVCTVSEEDSRVSLYKANCTISKTDFNNHIKPAYINYWQN